MNAEHGDRTAATMIIGTTTATGKVSRRKYIPLTRSWLRHPENLTTIWWHRILSKTNATRKVYSVQPTQLVKCTQQNRRNSWNVLDKTDTTREMYSAKPTWLVKCTPQNRSNSWNVLVLNKTDTTNEMYSAKDTQVANMYQATPTQLVKCTQQNWDTTLEMYSAKWKLCTLLD